MPYFVAFIMLPRAAFSYSLIYCEQSLFGQSRLSSAGLEIANWLKGGTGERREEEGLSSLLNQTCSGNSAHQRRQPVKNKLISHLISNNSASICRAVNPYGFAYYFAQSFYYDLLLSIRLQTWGFYNHLLFDRTDPCLRSNWLLVSIETNFDRNDLRSSWLATKKYFEICWQQCLSSTLVSSRKQLLSGQNHLTVVDHRWYFEEEQYQRWKRNPSR